MGKTRDLFKKIGEIKEIFHVKMDTIKDRNVKNITEEEKIRKNCQEYTKKKLYKKDVSDSDNLNLVAFHLEPDILHCQVKVALGSFTANKVSGSDEILAKLFLILKDYTVTMKHSICQQIWITSQWPQDWKRSVFISVSKKGNAKECSNYCTVALISHASKVMLKILQARLQQYLNQELPDVQTRFLKRQRTRDHITNIH